MWIDTWEVPLHPDSEDAVRGDQDGQRSRDRFLRWMLQEIQLKVGLNTTAEITSYRDISAAANSSHRKAPFWMKQASQPPAPIQGRPGWGWEGRADSCSSSSLSFFLKLVSMSDSKGEMNERLLNLCYRTELIIQFHMLSRSHLSG